MIFHIGFIQTLKPQTKSYYANTKYVIDMNTNMNITFITYKK